MLSLTKLQNFAFMNLFLKKNKFNGLKMARHFSNSPKLFSFRADSKECDAHELNDALLGNKSFSEEMLSQDPEYFKEV